MNQGIKKLITVKYEATEDTGVCVFVCIITDVDAASEERRKNKIKCGQGANMVRLKMNV